MFLRAKYLLWKAGEPPVENAVVEIRGQRIVCVGKFRSTSRKKVRDLGEVVLLPGLINAHCHLNYTHLAGKIPPPKSFTHWLREMIALKRTATPVNFAAATREGLRQLQRSGVTTVCDIVSDTGKPTQFLPLMSRIESVTSSSPLRLTTFFEQLDLGRPMLSAWKLQTTEKSNAASRHGWSPHSPYTASTALLRRAARSRLPLTIHIAESKDEWEMFKKKRGALFEMVRATDPAFACFNATTPVRFLDQSGVLTQRTLGVHMNYLTEKDFEIVRRSRMSVAHCPRSHEYFGHKKFAAERFLKLGVNICLGTDSAATISVSRHIKRHEESQPLDMFEEMRTFHRHHPKISLREILKLATLNGARAIGREKNLGSIERGKLADIIAVPATQKRRLEETIIHAQVPVALSMIGGTFCPIHPS